MTKLVWDQPGDKVYEAGVDRGVLYLPDGSGVPWNGLTSVDEDTSDIETSPYYFDGVKYLETRSPGDFSGNIKAFTYPPEFSEFDGYAALENGLLLGNQPMNSLFALSYRTLIGNDLAGSDFGYKIHIIYRITATPDTKSSSSMSDQQTINEFSWNITALPQKAAGYRPTAHLVIDTTRVNSYLVSEIEKILYGTDEVSYVINNVSIDGGTAFSSGIGSVDGGTVSTSGADGYDGGSAEDASYVYDPATDSKAILPPMKDLIDFISQWSYISISDNGDGTWTAIAPDDLPLIAYLDNTTFQINHANAIFSDPDTYSITDSHSL